MVTTWEPLGYSPQKRRWPRHNHRRGAEADIAGNVEAADVRAETREEASPPTPDPRLLVPDP